MNRKYLTEIPEHQTPKEKLPANYIIRSSIEKVQQQEVLHVSVFRQKNKKQKADARIFFYDNQYISLRLQNDGTYKWSRARIQNMLDIWHWNQSTIWSGCTTSAEAENIKEYLKIDFMVGGELKGISDFQVRLADEKLKKKHEKIKKRIDEDMDKVPGLPKDFEKWIRMGPFGFSKYIYYKRQGKTIEAYCTACEKDVSIPETRKTQKQIKHNNHGKCPNCQSGVTFKAIGKSTTLVDETHFAIMQKFGNGIVIRYFSGIRPYRKDYKNATTYQSEDIREIYTVENGKATKRRYERRNFMQTNELRWCDGNGTYGDPKPFLYTKNLKTVLKNGPWKYSGLYEQAKALQYIYPGNYLKEYLKHPEIEYLVKMKLNQLVDEGIELRGWRGRVNFKGKTTEERLGVTKQQLKRVQHMNLGEKGIGLIKMLEGIKISDKEILWALEHADTGQFASIAKHTTPHQIIRYAESQKRSGYTIGDIVSDWYDYLEMCQEQNFDIKNTFILFPKNLKEKHDELLVMQKSKGYEKYKNRVNLAAMELKHLAYEDKNYIIRAAESVEKIVNEGHVLRHCVGSENYIRGAAERKIAIMLVRKTNEPDKPFITVEVGLPGLNIKQSRGYQNQNPDEGVKKFIQKWQTKMQKKHIKQAREAV